MDEPTYGTGLSHILGAPPPREIVDRIVSEKTREAMDNLVGGYASSIDIVCGPENNTPETIRQGFLNVTVSIPRAVVEEFDI